MKFRNSNNLIWILTVAAFVAVLPFSLLAAPPQLPHLFYGTVTINGGPAPAGTVIIAKVGGIEKGRITTAAIGTYGGPGAYDGKLVVQGDDLTNGNTITFTVSEVNGTPTDLFENGNVEQLDLAFTISQVVVTPSGLGGLLDNGTINISGSAANASSATFTQIVVINVAVDGGTSSVNIPKDTVITKTGGGTFNANNLTASSVTPSSLSGLGTGVVVNGALQWGLANLGLEFSSPISISIFVGTALNGQTLNVQRSTTGNSGWTSDGISPATCVVSSGVCSFSTTRASYFVASHTVSTGGGGGGGGGGSGLTPVSTSTPAPGIAQKADMDKNGKVDIFDFNLLMVHWGETGSGNVADINGDNRVDILDFNSLMIYWTV